MASPIITAQTLGSPRNNFTGGVGAKIVVASAITITALARWIVSGNTGTHTLSLLNSSAGSLGSVSLATSGKTAGDYSYVNLATPVNLTAGGTYYVVSSETNGGDQWLDAGVVTMVSQISSWASVYQSGPSSYAVNAVGYAYVPVNALFTVANKVRRVGFGGGFRDGFGGGFDS